MSGKNKAKDKKSERGGRMALARALYKAAFYIPHIYSPHAIPHASSPLSIPPSLSLCPPRFTCTTSWRLLVYTRTLDIISFSSRDVQDPVE
jgi:hypothetical protein